MGHELLKTKTLTQQEKLVSINIFGVMTTTNEIEFNQHTSYLIQVFKLITHKN